MTDLRHRHAANVLLDALAAYDVEGDPAASEAAVRLALDRLQDIDAITVEVDDETGAYHVNPVPLLQGTLELLQLTVETLAHAHHADREATISTIREHLLVLFPDDESPTHR